MADKKILLTATLCVLVAGASLGTYAYLKPDWRIGVEQPEDCITRMMPASGPFTQPAAQHHRWVPTFTYDITKMDDAGVEELLAAGAHRVDNPRMQFASGGEMVPVVFSPAVSPAVSPADNQQPAAQIVFLADRATQYRLRDRAVATANAAAAGCSLQRPGMRLIDVFMAPPERGQLSLQDPSQPGS